METNYLSTLSSKGQLTVPKELRNVLKLKTGQIIVMELVNDNEVRLKKARIEAEDDDFTNEEWAVLRRMSGQKGKTYSTGNKFLKSLK